MRILFVHNGRERFVLDDLALLRRAFDVTDWYQPARHFNPWKLYQQLRSHDLVFCWFASWHALAPVLLAKQMGKPSMVVVGGYDTASVPEAGYGLQRSGLRRAVARAVIASASHLVAFSGAARTEAVLHAGADPARTSMVYLGVQPMAQLPQLSREPIALTVGGVWRENLLRKGLLPFVQAAAYLPDVRFVLAGRWYDDGINELRRAAGPNVELRGFVDDDELARLYARASVYVQASLHEGFGLSVAEAMSAGCIPVTTSAGSLPEVVGDTGVLLPNSDPCRIAEAVRRSMSASDDDRTRARARVLHLFPPQFREQALTRLITTLTRQAA